MGLTDPLSAPTDFQFTARRDGSGVQSDDRRSRAGKLAPGEIIHQVFDPQ